MGYELCIALIFTDQDSFICKNLSLRLKSDYCFYFLAFIFYVVLLSEIRVVLVFCNCSRRT